LYPVQVQGEEAPGQIVSALHIANRRKECDVLLLVRGGGSLEDLMAFNDEAVARALADSEIPVVAGVGHEIDFTIADFVADRRAATPSAAAELVSPARRELLQRIGALGQRGRLAQQRQLRELTARSEALWKRLMTLHPASRLGQQQQRIDELELRLRSRAVGLVQGFHAHLSTLNARLKGQTPAHRLMRWSLQLRERQRRLLQAALRLLGRANERLARASLTLDAVSPLATLSRGYAIVREHPDGPILRDAEQIRAGARIQAKLAKGKLICRVDEVWTDDCP
jgi:exodeoxyribonuclease VII large subunit